MLIGCKLQLLFEEQKSKNNHGTAFDVQPCPFIGDTDLAKKNSRSICQQIDYLHKYA
jgi:hypothetical protein